MYKNIRKLKFSAVLINEPKKRSSNAVKTMQKTSKLAKWTVLCEGIFM